MANANTPYIAKQAAPLVNPTSASVFLQVVPTTPNTSIVQQAAFTVYKGYASVNQGISNNVNVVRIAVRAAGRVVGGTTTNFTPSIVFFKGPAPALPANFATTVGAMTATAFNSATGNWSLDATLLWDPVSGQINGSVSGFAGSGGAQTLMSATAITPVTGITVASPAVNVSGAYSAGEQQLFFAVAGVFSASNAGNTAYLDLFETEAL